MGLHKQVTAFTVHCLCFQLKASHVFLVSVNKHLVDRFLEHKSAKLISQNCKVSSFMQLSSTGSAWTHDEDLGGFDQINLQNNQNGVSTVLYNKKVLIQQPISETSIVHIRKDKSVGSVPILSCSKVYSYASSLSPTQYWKAALRHMLFCSSLQLSYLWWR